MLRLSRRVNAPAVHFSFIRTVTVGSGFPPDLLTPPRGGRSRALPESGNTAGGDFHPAPKTNMRLFSTSIVPRRPAEVNTDFQLYSDTVFVYNIP